MKKEIRLEKKYLKIPIVREGENREVSFYLGDEKLYQFAIPVRTADGGSFTGHYGHLPVGELTGRVLTLEAEGPLPEGILQSDELAGRREECYPAIHFAPESGWLNDPNGLCFYRGEYHLFFQHNMFAEEWNNISWGHAVSRDLLHWEQVEDALLPDGEGPMFSGCAVVNEGDSPLSPPGTLLLFYTCAGGRSAWSKDKRFTLKAAWSADGRTFQKLPEVILPHMVEENRDPKIGRSKKTGQYYMVLFLTGHTYAVFVSENLRDWRKTQELEIPESWECPDLIRLTAPDGTEKWVFWTADGYYLTGSFDGECFTREQEGRCLYGNKMAYAAQTFWGTGERVLQIPWMRLRREDRPYRGLMGIPRELELVCAPSGYLLAAHLPAEVYAQEQRLWESKGWTAGQAPVRFAWDPEGAVLVQVQNAQNRDFRLVLCSNLIAWNSRAGLLAVNGEEIPLKELKDLTLLLDRELLEAGCNGDTVCIACGAAEEKERAVCFEGLEAVTLGVIR